MRVGFGYDVHKLVPGRPLVLGGIEIEYERGLLGHSDADVLLHAICDAMIGAAALGDIGVHFPDTDPEFKDVSSLVLLVRTFELIKGQGFKLKNIDSTIVAQRPRLAPFIPRMVERISSRLGLNPGCVNIKAKTTETLGFAGREEGIAAYAVALVEESAERRMEPLVEV
ncbi:MAG: 2-C-methyl-D-erythritol 2,4-cyclodiphosphate synthase [Deltaproteobacteria bacterium]|jgi:2-C-methyl-D-erythritol 2,4-cyclodiphosphate synthase|nr:2-C-methyl-D-erythritol 2,4-cyclodiphosphate synthase [Deltaproteobacteria bacterium]